jgi:hypothetical protein
MHALQIEPSYVVRSDGMRLISRAASTNGPIVNPPDESHGGIVFTGGNRISRRETCPSVTSSAKNST